MASIMKHQQAYMELYDKYTYEKTDTNTRLMKGLSSSTWNLPAMPFI